MWHIILQNFLKVAVVVQWLNSQFSGGDGENWPENLLESLIFSRDVLNDAIGAVNRGGRLNWLQWCTVWALKISLALVRLIAVIFKLILAYAIMVGNLDLMVCKEGVWKKSLDELYHEENKKVKNKWWLTAEWKRSFELAYMEQKKSPDGFVDGRRPNLDA